MKYSIVFFSSWAALAAAAPLDERQAEVKLPYKEPGQFSIDCGFRGSDEETCGTDWYCTAFDESPKPLGLDGPYESSKECFDAHEPREPNQQPAEPSQTPKEQFSKAQEENASGTLPFIDAAKLSGVCFPGQFEECMGTQKYCDSKAWTKKDEPKQYTSAEACLADREPSQSSDGPAPAKKPWIYNNSGAACRMDSEECLGSELFCLTSKRKARSQECLAEREKPKLPWLAPGTCANQSEACLGTEGYCAVMMQAIKASVSDCVARRDPKP
ncbi:hypothetical protein LEL_06841 [Akanthomyces lecanii RCEF 1005]|uniref:Uncharacterized protein n=1 Tax=Akanthomyces lecanii RCEF 1005 TaxID=1081108 RepID=A0A168F9H8_CORDF|nr:hypothetical protein LEL_06841 [Akanthomyces lecanii RCEF 1005]